MMTNLAPTYVRENGKVYAFLENRIIAVGNTFREAEQSAVDYLDSLTKKRKKDEDKEKEAHATHITTPNGVKGKILSRVEGVWGEKELTVRLENGRVAKFVAKGNEQYTNEKTASVDDPVDGLRKWLDEGYGRDRESLSSRVASLEEIISQASEMVSESTTYSNDQKLDRIVLEAEAEKQEVQSALDYLEKADESTVTAAAPSYHAVEQAEMGRAKNDNWIDKTAEDMVKEVEGINFDKMLLEEPGQFAAELETGTLQSPESTSEMALAHIVSKTAAFVGEDLEQYREKFVAATEVARQKELEAREVGKTKGEKKAKKLAKKEAKKIEKLPDEALFW